MAGIEVNIAPAYAVRLTNSRRVIGCIQTSSEVQHRSSQERFTPGLFRVGSYQVGDRVSGALWVAGVSFRMGIFFGLVVPAHPVTDAAAQAPLRGLWRRLDLSPQPIEPLDDEINHGRFEAVVGDVRLAALDGCFCGP